MLKSMKDTLSTAVRPAAAALATAAQIVAGKADDLPRLQQERVAVVAALEAARQRLKGARAAAARAADGPGRAAAQRAVDEAEHEAARLTRRVDELDDVVAVLEAEAVDKAEADRAAAVAERMRQHEKNLSARLDAARDVEKAADAFAEAAERYHETCAKIRDHAPMPIDQAAALVLPGDAQSCIRLQAVRAGLDWAAPWLPSRGLPPAIVERVERANVEAMRDASAPRVKRPIAERLAEARARREAKAKATEPAKS